MPSSQPSPLLCSCLFAFPFPSNGAALRLRTSFPSPVAIAIPAAPHQKRKEVNRYYIAEVMAPTPLMGSSSSSGPPVAMGDRLSSLPDALLHTIMSFLPARQAVQTCVLSRRWEDLWCSMPCISIDQQEFDMAASGNMNDLENARESSRFEEFVNSLLMFHKAPSLEMFRFHVTRPYKFEVLALHEDSGIIPTFSNLRTLLFNGCDLSDDFQMLGYFMNNTPSLEKLTLQYCKLPEDSKKRKRMENPKRIPIKCHDTLTFQCPNLKLIEIKYKEDDVHQLFGLLSGIWRNLLKTTIILTKA
nr:unnamed protein product [Digitaria exilis]